MPMIEARLGQELRKLAYAVPNGVGDYDLLRSSDRMSAAAQDWSQARQHGPKS